MRIQKCLRAQTKEFLPVQIFEWHCIILVLSKVRVAFATTFGKLKACLRPQQQVSAKYIHSVYNLAKKGI